MPSLLGAILVKARAIAVDDEPQAQRTDLAFLLSLVPDPDLLTLEMSTAERRWLRRHAEFADSDSPWMASRRRGSDTDSSKPAFVSMYWGQTALGRAPTC